MLLMVEKTVTFTNAMVNNKTQKTALALVFAAGKQLFACPPPPAPIIPFPPLPSDKSSGCPADLKSGVRTAVG